MTEKQRQQHEAKIDFLTNGAKTPGHPQGKKRKASGHRYFTSFTNRSNPTIKPPEGNTGESLDDLRWGNNFLDTGPKYDS